MSEETHKKVRGMEEESDPFNKLPDGVLTSIISLLPVKELVRTSVLSTRWKTMWKYSSHLDFNQKQILKSSIEFYMQNSEPYVRLQIAIHREVDPEDEEVFDTIADVAIRIVSIINNHLGPLESCRILHLTESCASGDVVRWMRKLIEKRVIKVSLERESCDLEEFIGEIILMNAAVTLNLPFELLSSFEILELKNYYLNTKLSSNHQQVLKTLTLNKVRIISNNFNDIISHCLCLENLTIKNCRFLEEVKIVSHSLKYIKICDVDENKIFVAGVNVEIIEIECIICNYEELIFETPKLRVLCCYNDVNMIDQYLSLNGNSLLTTRDILEIFGGILGHQGSSMRSIFENLGTLCLDLELENARNAMALSTALKSLNQLKNLRINNQVKVNLDENDDDSYFYPGGLFWPKREPCRCVSHNLKFLTIKGYKGGEFAVEFLKYLILNGGAMEDITIWFLDDCSWAEVITSVCLLSYQQLSPKLSIDFKPGEEYRRKYGGNFDMWLRTLK